MDNEMNAFSIFGDKNVRVDVKKDASGSVRWLNVYVSGLSRDMSNELCAQFEDALRAAGVESIARTNSNIDSEGSRIHIKNDNSGSNIDQAPQIVRDKLQEIEMKPQSLELGMKFRAARHNVKLFKSAKEVAEQEVAGIMQYLLPEALASIKQAAVAGTEDQFTTALQEELRRALTLSRAAQKAMISL